VLSDRYLRFANYLVRTHLQSFCEGPAAAACIFLKPSAPVGPSHEELLVAMRQFGFKMTFQQQRTFAPVELRMLWRDLRNLEYWINNAMVYDQAAFFTRDSSEGTSVKSIPRWTTSECPPLARRELDCSRLWRFRPEDGPKRTQTLSRMAAPEGGHQTAWPSTRLDFMPSYSNNRLRERFLDWTFPCSLAARRMLASRPATTAWRARFGVFLPVC
jgi:hypothetical protein